MRAFLLPMIVAALAFWCGVVPIVDVARAQPRNDLDDIAYGRPSTYSPNDQPGGARASPADSGGALAALRRALSWSSAGAPHQEAPEPQPAQGTARAAYQAYAAAPPAPVHHETAYRLDAGDKLRVVVYGQDGLSNTYAIDAGGSITLPLIGAVPARGRSTPELANAIAAKLRNGFVREPSVAVEVETYRPFFILGEVAAPGQYPYVPNLTVESAVAIAGGFSPRARRDTVMLTHTDSGGPVRYTVPLGTSVSPGDTVMVGERWF